MKIDTRTALLNSAESAARRMGYDGFSYADLADEVGIRKASIHHHFPTKAALATALMQRYFTTLEAVCADIDETEAIGAGRLRMLIAQYRTALDEGKSLCLCVSFSISRDKLPPGVIDEIGQFRRMMIGWITKAFEVAERDGSVSQMATPHLEATALLPLLEGAQLTARVEEDVALFDDATRLLLARLGSG